MIPAELADHSSSGKLVYRALHQNGAMRVTEIVAELSISENTVRSALADLREADVVIERPVAHDARRRVYVLREAFEDGEPPAQRFVADQVTP